MSEYKETVTRSHDEVVDASGKEVEQETRSVDTTVSEDSQSVASNVVTYIFGFIAILLAFRFFLKLFGANPNGGFVDFIYSVTGVLTAPFDNIFGVTSAETGTVRSVFEPSILVAIAVYLLIGWGLVKLLNINRKQI